MNHNSEYLQPKDHLRKLLLLQQPCLRWDGIENVDSWQLRSREKLSELLGLPLIRPFAAAPNLQIEYDRVCEDLHCREIRFTFFSEEDVSVPCHLLIPLGAAARRPLAICIQGHSTGMHISMGRIKYPHDIESISGGDRDFARRALQEKICALTIEQRCFGESGGTENGPDCTDAAMRAILLGRTIIGERVWDVMRCIDVVQDNFSALVDTEKILCIGNSGGGTTIIYASALDPRIRISVPSCSLSCYADSIGSFHHCECNYVPGIIRYFDMGDLCAMCAPRHLIVVNGKDDDGFPIDGAKRCIAEARRCYSSLASSENLVHVIGNGGHRFYADDAWPCIRKALSALAQDAC